jgi:hypothetical protein
MARDQVPPTAHMSLRVADVIADLRMTQGDFFITFSSATGLKNKQKKSTRERCGLAFQDSGPTVKHIHVSFSFFCFFLFSYFYFVINLFHFLF